MAKIGYIVGVFDLFHNGHINIIDSAMKMCDAIVIGVHTDDFVTEYKRKPIRTQEERKQDILNHYKDKILHIDFIGNSHVNIIRDHNVTHMFHGTDWELEGYKKQIGYYKDKLDVEIVLIPYTLGVSTTKMIADSARYKSVKTFLFDLDKTLLLNDDATHGAVECIRLIQERGLEIQVISNNNRYTPEQISEYLIRAGINIEESQINSSLRQIRNYIVDQGLSRVFVWGSANAKQYLAEYSTDDISDATLIIVLYNNSFTYDELTTMMTHIRNGKPYVIGNIDILYPDKNIILPDTGAIYSMIQQTTNIVPVKKFGKPFAENYELTNSKESYLIVGDSLMTDGVLATNLGVEFFHINDTCSMKTLEIILRL